MNHSIPQTQPLVTVIYACHDPEASTHPDFPSQTIPSSQIEILPVFEDDPCHSRKNSMELILKAKGAYIIMLDEYDLFPEDFLELLIKEVQSESLLLAMPAMVSQHVERKIEPFAHISETKFLVNTRCCFTVFPTELHGILFVKGALADAFNLYRNETEPEKRMLLYLFQRRNLFCYLGNLLLKYAWPKELDYQYNLCCLSREWYFDPFEKFLLPVMKEEYAKHGSCSRILQTLALSMILNRIHANADNANKHVISAEEAPGYTEIFSQVLQYINIDTIITLDSNLTNTALKNKLFLVRLKKRDFSYYPEMICSPASIRLLCDGVTFGNLKNNLKINVNLIDYVDGCLEIDGSINDYFDDRQAVVYAMFGKHKIPVTFNKRYSLSKCFGVTYARMKTFHVSVPIDPDYEHSLRFRFDSKGIGYWMPFAFPSHTSRFSKELSFNYWRFGRYLSFLKEGGIQVVPATPKTVFSREFLVWLQLIKRSGNELHRDYLKLRILNFLLKPYFSSHKTWLFFDKIYKGGDSSEYLYKYTLEQKDGIKKYYLLDKNSADYSRMKKEGYKPLVRGSLWHRLVFLNADMVIASNSTVFAFNDYPIEKSVLIRGDVHFDVACVQHGMSVQKIAVAQNRLRDNTKLYFCASPYEIKNLSRPVYDYQGYDALKLTGVPRYDGLKSRAEKILLFSPTWRMQSALPVTKNEGIARDYNPNFKKTSYYQVYNSLLNDPRLIEAARKYGYRIQYVLHPIVSPQAEDFDRNEFVEIIPAIGDMSYEKLFCEAALMVTDFSGVQFDFAYMRKPVVYLHHNDIPQHYEEGTFYYDTMGFGEICHTNEELIEVLCNYMKHDCEMPPEYRRRADDFFCYSDNHNCERIYPIMIEHEKKRDIPHFARKSDPPYIPECLKEEKS